MAQKIIPLIMCGGAGTLAVARLALTLVQQWWIRWTSFATPDAARNSLQAS